MTEEHQGPVIDDTPQVTTNEVVEKSESSKPESETVEKVLKSPADVRHQQDFDMNITEKIIHGDHIHLPGEFTDRVEETLMNLPNINMVDNPESRRWAESLNEGIQFNTVRKVFVDTVSNPESSFRQKVEHNNIPLMGAKPKFKHVEGENLKGERAVIRVISHLGIGTLFQVPLWHSGFWITFKPPTESEIVELNRILTSDKITFGRSSYALAFANTTVYSVNRLVDFALAHIYDITCKSEEITINNIKDHISSQDIPSLLWGFICTMYPRGFKYSRACVANPDKCNHVVEDTLNVTKLQWTNTSGLTDWQKTHMSFRQARGKDLASVKRYKEELSRSQKTKFTVTKENGDELNFIIKTPSITEHIDSGHRWIGDIVETVDKAVSSDMNKAERDSIITRHGQASAMRNYAHWVDSIEYIEGVVDDRETIETVLDSLSADDEVRNKFIDIVVGYINSSTISVIGIPTFDCPKCGTEQPGSEKLPKFTSIIPLDVIQVFFELITQRLSRVTER